ncbi:MAG TPA: RICIN domain-containing protein [Acidobacteriaceae bacterium]|nr:RICIN domain-containing protein [Acidobacteriaceae bacterium]
MAVASLAIGLSSGAQAQEAVAAFNAYNSAFLVQSGSTTCYSFTLVSVGTNCATGWTGATDISLAADAFQHTHDQADLTLLNSLVASFITQNGSNFLGDGWNDDIGWDLNPITRDYQMSGNSSYLTIIENNWNGVYNRSWDTTNGGIWENTSNLSKCALSNDPFIADGVVLYQETGDSTYLTKAEAIYNWVRTKLVNTTNSNNSLGSPGQVNGCIKADGTLQGSDNAYDDGTFVEAANALYRVTGNSEYYNDALLTINHRVNEGTPLYTTAECCGHVWSYWFTLGLNQFLNDTGQWPNYQTYLQNNANQAWSERNSINITWNDWRNPTNDSGTDGMEMEGAAAIWQHLPPVTPSFSGNYEIESAVSGMALKVSGGSTANGAAIVQEPFVSGDNSALWTFTPTGGGYYHITNVNSGQAMNVKGASVLAKALIDQWPTITNLIPGNDLWMPVSNSNGTITFYNLNSLQALNDPGGSTTAGVQYDQWWGTGGAGETFNVISR